MSPFRRIASVALYASHRVKLIYSYHDSLGETGRIIQATEAYSLDRPQIPSRPWVGMCMVSSIDGSTVVNGDSAPLSNAADRSVLVALRTAADMILVGAGTVRDEGYGVPSKAGQRVAVVSRSGNLDLTTALFTSSAGFLILPENAPMQPVESIRQGTNEVDLGGVLRYINKTSSETRFIQLEGGAMLNGTMVAADLVDEINLTVSPQVTGGNGPRLTTNAPDLALGYRLQHVLEDEGFLFLRYLRQR